MKKTATLLYASKTGFTRKAAEISVEILEEAGYACTLLDAAEAPLFEKSDLFIVGGPIIMGKMPREIFKTLETNRAVLEKKGVALFLTCLRLTNAPDRETLPFEVFSSPVFTEEAKPLKKMSLLEKSHEIGYYFNAAGKTLSWLTINSGAVFKGGLNYSRLNLLQRIFMRFMSLLQKNQKEGDFIDEALLREWIVKVTREGEGA